MTDSTNSHSNNRMSENDRFKRIQLTPIPTVRQVSIDGIL